VEERVPCTPGCACTLYKTVNLPQSTSAKSSTYRSQLQPNRQLTAVNFSQIVNLLQSTSAKPSTYRSQLQPNRQLTAVNLHQIGNSPRKKGQRPGSASWCDEIDGRRARRRVPRRALRGLLKSQLEGSLRGSFKSQFLKGGWAVSYEQGTPVQGYLAHKKKRLPKTLQ